jgi:hypothetical protein
MVSQQAATLPSRGSTPPCNSYVPQAVVAQPLALNETRKRIQSSSLWRDTDMACKHRW